jgi:hypothetical protein
MVLVKFYVASLFCLRIGYIVSHADVAEDDLFVFNPLEYFKLFKFNMVGVPCRLFGICHEAGVIIVFLYDGW